MIQPHFYRLSANFNDSLFGGQLLNQVFSYLNIPHLLLSIYFSIIISIILHIFEFSLLYQHISN
jgi:hypothetical protein